MGINNPESGPKVEMVDISGKKLESVTPDGNKINIHIVGEVDPISITREDFKEAFKQSRFIREDNTRILRLIDGRQIKMSTEQVSEVLKVVETHNISKMELSHVVVEDEAITIYVGTEGYVIKTTTYGFSFALNSSKIVKYDTPQSLSFADGTELIMSRAQIEVVQKEVEYNSGIRSRVAEWGLGEYGEIKYLNYTPATRIYQSGNRIRFNVYTGPSVNTFRKAMSRISFDEFESHSVIQLLCPSGSYTDVLNIVSVTRDQYRELEKILNISPRLGD